MAIERVTMELLREVEMLSDSEGRYFVDVARMYALKEFQPQA
jgi:hypothetical protein